MKGLIDLQCFISESAHRGIGRYSYNLLKNLKKIESDISFLGLLPASSYKRFLTSQASELFSRDQIILFECEDIPRVNFIDVNLKNRFLLFQSVKGLKLDFFLQLSPLAEPVNSWVSPDLLYDSVPTYSIFYDSFSPSRQNIDEEFRYQQYIERTAYLKNVDGFLCISKKSDGELRRLMGDQVDSVVIGGGPTLDLPFSKNATNANTTFFFPGAGDPRKGGEVLLEAVRQISGELHGDVKFVLSATENSFGAKLKAQVRKNGLKKYFSFFGTLNEKELISCYLEADAIVFPSKNEGLGLPILDAQSIGKPCLIPKTPELMEICFDAEFSFEPENSRDLGELIKKFVLNTNFREERIRIAQKSRAITQNLWVRTSRVSLDYMRRNIADVQTKKQRNSNSEIVFITPLPPEKTGIADFNESLLAELTNIVHLEGTHGFDAFIKVLISSNVVLVLGNSPHHYPAFSFIPFCIPAFDIHDVSLDRFFETLPYREIETTLAKFILLEFGLQAVYEMQSRDKVGIPLGTKLLQNLISRSSFTITHNSEAAKLIRSDRIIPLWWRKNLHKSSEKKSIEDEIVVSTFGFIDATKQLDVIVSLLGASRFRKQIHFFVVGSGHPKLVSYLKDLAKKSELQVTFTGFVEKEMYLDHLNSTDIAIQMRDSQRSESPGSVIDCLEFGLPTITNSKTAAEYYSSSGNFYHLNSDENLTDLVDQIIRDRVFKSATQLDSALSPSLSASSAAGEYMKSLLYRNTPSIFLSKENQSKIELLLNRLVLKGEFSAELRKFKVQQLRPKIYFVLTDEVIKSSADGILRVAKTFFDEFMFHSEYPLIPVIRENDKLILATDLGLINKEYTEIFDKFELKDFSVNPTKNDVVVFPGMDADLAKAAKQIIRWKESGTRIVTIVHDVLPLSNPELFLEGFPEVFENWLNTSLQVSTDFVFDSHVSHTNCQQFIQKNGLGRLNCFVIKPFIEKFPVLKIAKSEITSFIMVGTIEPRKGHSLVLDEFEKVWALGIKVQLNIIGRVGWNSEEVIKRIERLIVAGERISWSESTSDLELNQSLAKSHFLVCASTHEGYCLPGLEANAVGLGVIARNIPVYREGLGNFAYFFESDNPDKETALSDVVVAITKGVGDKHKLSDQELGIVSSDKSPETTWRIFLGDSR